MRRNGRKKGNVVIWLLKKVLVVVLIFSYDWSAL
jgi:hypothetical protein